MTTTEPPQPAAVPTARYEIRRRHDCGLISEHCCAHSALAAFEQLQLPELIGPVSPGPLQWAGADIIDRTTGESVAYTCDLVPLHWPNPPQVISYP